MTFAPGLRRVRLAPWLLAIATWSLAACNPPSEARNSDTRPTTIAAGGLVEPQGEERVVIPEFSGRLKKVYIEEGEAVSAGQVLAEIENSDYAAAVAAAKAQVALREANLTKLRRGARPEELREAQASLAEASAARVLAEQDLERVEPLVKKRQLSPSALDAARSEAAVAQAREHAAAERLALLRAGTRSEDLAIADAELSAAKAELARAEAIYAKTLIRSPVDGIVLKRDLREGETVVSLSPIPLARIGDMRKLYVRADIDELDIARVHTGQPATIRSDALPGKHFAGRVVLVSRRMGKRNAGSDNPAEKVDAKVLQALIALDGQPPLPVGLRVDVVIDTASPATP